MKEYMLTVIYMTYRPGGFDLLADSLKNQTYKNYELIVVDDFPDSSKPVKEYLLKHNLPVTYCGPSKEKCYSDTPYNLCNAMNTGLLHSKGDIVILIMDYAWLEPDALEKWNKAFNEQGLKKLIVGVGYTYGTCASDPEILNPISIWSPPYPERFSFEGDAPIWLPELFEMFYTGFPSEFFDQINGFDERGDYWSPNMYYSIVEQAKLNDYALYVDTSNGVKLVEHRNWDTFDSDLWWIGRWKVENVKMDVPWIPRSPNCFNLRRDRKRN